MKKDIHPSNYRPVLFVDNSSGAEFIIASTVETEERAKAKSDNLPASSAEGQAGKEYPVYHVEISSSSHPFYTGEVRTLDSAGRVERFKQKQAQATSKGKKGK